MVHHEENVQVSAMHTAVLWEGGCLLLCHCSTHLSSLIISRFWARVGSRPSHWRTSGLTVAGAGVSPARGRAEDTIKALALNFRSLETCMHCSQTERCNKGKRSLPGLVLLLPGPLTPWSVSLACDQQTAESQVNTGSRVQRRLHWDTFV
jgi:hypothetical protein